MGANGRVSHDVMRSANVPPEIMRNLPAPRVICVTHEPGSCRNRSWRLDRELVRLPESAVRDENGRCGRRQARGRRPSRLGLQ